MSSATAIRAGELRHLVQFERDAGTAGAGAAVEHDWQPVGSAVRCKLTPLSGSRLFWAQRTQSKVTHTLIMRYRSDADPTWRVRMGERVFTIEALLNVEERNRKIEMQLAEITS